MRSVFICVLLAGLAIQAHAGETDGDLVLAQKRFATGQYLYETGRYQQALDEFLAAKVALHRPELDFNIARCLTKLGRNGEAADSYEIYLRARPLDPDRAEIWHTISELRAASAKEQADEAHRLAIENGTMKRQYEEKLLTLNQSISASHAPPVPVYKRWWFWGSVVGAVVVGAAVGLGVGFGTGHNASNPHLPAGVNAQQY